MKVAAAYIRVSTEEQTELSPDSQIKLIRDYAKKNDMILPQEFIFQDDGISGRSAAKRPAFNKMIGVAKSKPKPFDVILLWKFSRFARNREDSIVFKSMLRKDLGIDVISITENLGDDKMSILIEALIEAMDEYYSVNLAEEVRRGMSEKFNRGKLVSSPPFGYDAVKGNLVINETEAAVVKRIYNDFINGKPIVALAKELNAEGIKNKRSKAFDNRGINYILTNPVYNGKVRWSTVKAAKTRYKDLSNTKIINGVHKKIIDDELFKRAGAIMENNKNIYGYYGRQQPADYIFKGIVRCHSCGSTLTRSKNGLQCHSYSRGKCQTSHYISFKKLNVAIIDYLESSLNAPNLTVERTDAKKDTVDYEKQLKNEKIKLERVKAAFENGIDTIDEYKNNKNRILKSIADIENKMQNSQIDNFDMEEFKGHIRMGIEALKNDDILPAEKNVILRQFISKIVYDSSEHLISIFFHS